MPKELAVAAVAVLALLLVGGGRGAGAVLGAAVLVSTLVAIIVLGIVHTILAAVSFAVRVTADAGWGTDGAICGGGWWCHGGGTEALACVHKAGSCGCSFRECWGCKICKVRCGGRGERSRGEGREWSQACGAVPGRSRRSMPMVLFVDAMKDVTY